MDTTDLDYAIVVLTRGRNDHDDERNGRPERGSRESDVIRKIFRSDRTLGKPMSREFDDRISHRLMLLYRRTKAFEKLHHSDNLEFKIVPPFTLVFLNVKLATTYI